MDDSSAAISRRSIMRQLRQQLGHCETTFSTEEAATFSSGAAPLDRLLPAGGLRHGMLVEWLAEGPASGAATLSLLSAREACRLGGLVVVIDRQQMFYPPAAAARGIDLNRLIVVRPQTARDELWATVQSLRSPVVAAVWATIQQIDDRAFRRLQLAAEVGHTLGLLLRPTSARGQPSWADVRLWVERRGMRNEEREKGAGGWGLGTGFGKSWDSGSRLRGTREAGRLDPRPCRRVHVRMLHCHVGRPGSSAWLDIDDVAHVVREVNTDHDSHPLPVVAELADPTALPSSAGA
jgi:protein ImuA